MARPSKYPRELREPAVRAVVESMAEGGYPSKFEAIRAIAGNTWCRPMRDDLDRWRRRRFVEIAE